MSEIRDVYLNQLQGADYLWGSSTSISQLSQQKENSILVKDVNSEYTIPTNYNSNKIFLEVKNPITAYAYWEYTFDKINKVIFSAGYDDIREVGLLLRVYDLTASDNYGNYYDLKISFSDESCYLDGLKQGHKYLAKLGVVDQSNRFHSMIESNQIIL